MNITKVSGVHPYVLAGLVAVKPGTAANHRGAMVYLESIGIDCTHGSAENWLRGDNTESDGRYNSLFKYIVKYGAMGRHGGKPIMPFDKAFFQSRVVRSL